jgi:chaperonin GroES
MVEQGMKVFNGIYKRTHRAQTQEFRKLYRLNTIFLSEDMPYYANAVSAESRRAATLYRGASVIIRCSADPFYMSDAQRYNQATALLQVAHSSPGYDLYQVNRYYLQALKIPTIDLFLPDPKGPFAVPPAPNPKIVEAQMKAQAAQMKAQLDFKIKLMELVQGAEKQAAEIKLLEAQVVQTLAEAKGVDTGHQIAILEAQIGAAKNKQEGTLEALKILQQMSKESDDGGSKSGGMGSMAGASGNAGGMGDAATAPQGVGGSPFGALPTAGSPF